MFRIKEVFQDVHLSLEGMRRMDTLRSESDPGEFD